MKRKTVAVALTVLALISVSASSCDSTDKKTAQQTGQEQTETAFSQQQAAVPYPGTQLRNSLERQNLKDKLLRLNNASKVGYVYLLNFGKIIGYYVIKGKVSSNQSQMTTTNLIERHSGDSGGGNVVVPAPGDDGSYGDNEAGIFFFTAENVYVSTSVDYLYSDAPLAVDAPKLNAGPPSK